jgi:uncharacterized protein
VPLDPQLLDILACPDSHHTPLVYDEPGQTLTCPECGRVFPINDGLPELLLEDAGNESDAEANESDAGGDESDAGGADPEGFERGPASGETREAG